MLNYLWAGMMAVGVIWAAFHGTLPEVTDAVISSAREAVTLSITMLGIMAFWSGIMEIGNGAGLIGALTAKLGPVLNFLFPALDEDHPARKQIAANLIANMLGLSWAATPAGLRAMKELERLEDDRRAGRAAGPARPKGTAGNEMCTFLIINISSLQLIPVSIIAYRSQYGSVNPAAITGPAILATAVSTAAAVVFCRITDRSGGGNPNGSGRQSRSGG